MGRSGLNFGVPGGWGLFAHESAMGINVKTFVGIFVGIKKIELSNIASLKAFGKVVR